MTTDRSYRKARSAREALEELERCAGTQFDPVVAEALIAVVQRRLDHEHAAAAMLPDPLAAMDRTSVSD